MRNSGEEKNRESRSEHLLPGWWSVQLLVFSATRCFNNFHRLRARQLPSVDEGVSQDGHKFLLFRGCHHRIVREAKYGSAGKRQQPCSEQRAEVLATSRRMCRKVQKAVLKRVRNESREAFA